MSSRKRALFLHFDYTVFYCTAYPICPEPYTAICTAAEAKKGNPPKRADPLKIAKTLDFYRLFLNRNTFSITLQMLFHV